MAGKSNVPGNSKQRRQYRRVLDWVRQELSIAAPVEPELPANSRLRVDIALGLVAMAVTIVISYLPRNWWVILAWSVLLLFILIHPVVTFCTWLTQRRSQYRNGAVAVGILLVGTGIASWANLVRPKPEVPVLTMQLSPSQLPLYVPPHSVASILQLDPYNAPTDTQDWLFKVVNDTGKEGCWPSREELDSKGASFEGIYRVGIANHSRHILESGKIIFGLKYNTGIGGGGCMSPSGTHPDQEDVVLIPPLEPGKSFEFYAVNQTNHCVWLLPPKSATVKMEGDEKDRKVDLMLDKNPLYSAGAPVFSASVIKWKGLPQFSGGFAMIRTGSYACDSGEPKPRPPTPHIHVSVISFSIPDVAMGHAETKVTFINDGKAPTKVLAGGKMAWYVEQQNIQQRWAFEDSIIRDEPKYANASKFPFAFDMPVGTDRSTTLFSTNWDQSAVTSFLDGKASIYAVGTIFYKDAGRACSTTYCMYMRKDGNAKFCLKHNEEVECGE